MKSKHEHKEILLLFMSDTSGFEMDLDKDTETWTNLLDRGGLYHVSDTTHNLFYHMELELCKYYNLRAAVMEANSKPFIMKKISDNNEVLHQWHTLTEDQGDILLIIDELYITMIAEFVTVRGFSFAASIVEAYKKVSSKNLQKPKDFVKVSQIRSVFK